MAFIGIIYTNRGDENMWEIKDRKITKKAESPLMDALSKLWDNGILVNIASHGVKECKVTRHYTKHEFTSVQNGEMLYLGERQDAWDFVIEMANNLD